MDEPGQFEGQFLVRIAAFRRGLVLGFERGDVLYGQEGEELEQLDDLGVLDLDEELVKAIDAGPCR